jgi:hypothetical protein
MPGAYAHITLVNELKEPQRLELIPGFPRGAIPSILKYFKFCELGAVSPDYPYLAIGDEGAKQWADTMHYTRTGEMIHAGVKRLQAIGGDASKKCLAWLLGYAAHVTTDVTIHPVVEMKVGPYQGHEKPHRICEMHQDAYIFQRLNLGEVGLSEHLDSGIAACRDRTDPNLLDRDIVSLWTGMLRDVHTEEFAANPPDIDKWHRGFNFVIGKIAEEGDHLFPFARHLAVDSGLTYPAKSDIDPQYIKDLATPNGKQDYDVIFNAAIGNVGNIWQIAASGATQGQKTYLARIGNWNLDTGRDERKRLVFWGIV